MGLGLNSLRAGADAIAARPMLREEAVGSSTLGAHVSSMPIFARNDVGQPLQPVTAAAYAIVEAPDGGERATRILEAASRRADERPDSRFRGIVLPATPADYDAWVRLREISSGIDETGEIYDGPPSGGSGEDTQALFARAAAHYDDGYLVSLGTESNGGLPYLLTGDPAYRIAGFERELGALTPDEVIYVRGKFDPTRDPASAKARSIGLLLHELEHDQMIDDYMMGSPAVAEASRVFEEGGDHTITYWPGQRERFVTSAGLEDEVPAELMRRIEPGGYSNEHAKALGLVKRAGIDVTSPDAVTDAIALLRGRRPFAEALDGVAALIGQREGRHVTSQELHAVLSSTVVSDAAAAAAQAKLDEALRAAGATQP